MTKSPAWRICRTGLAYFRTHALTHYRTHALTHYLAAPRSRGIRRFSGTLQ